MDLGFIKPDEEGRWRWPFRQMEIGDSFKVLPEMKAPGAVRQMAYNRGEYLGRTFATKVLPDGSIFVERIDKSKRQVILTYGTLRKRIAARYGLNLDEINWFEIAGKLRIDAKGEGPQVRIRTSVADDLFDVTLDRDFVEIELVRYSAKRMMEG